MRMIKSVMALYFSLFNGAVPMLGKDQAFSPDDRSFTIKMPGVPKCATERVNVFGETVEVHMCVYADVPAHRFYSVTYLNRDRSSLAVDDKTALRGGYEGAMVMSNSRVISEREVTIDGFLGIECVWRANDINMSSTKLFVLTKEKMVIVDISGQPGKIPADVIRRFLDTLRITANASSSQ